MLIIQLSAITIMRKTRETNSSAHDRVDYSHLKYSRHATAINLIFLDGKGMRTNRETYLLEICPALSALLIPSSHRALLYR